MVLTAPISYPVGWVLDLVLGHRHTALFRWGGTKQRRQGSVPDRA